MATRRKRGKVELATARGIRKIGEVPDGLEGLAESALTLARCLDEGAGLATAAVARELRATLVKLAEKNDGGDEPDPFEAELEAYSRAVPAGVGDSAY